MSDKIIGLRHGSPVFSYSRVEADLSGLPADRQEYYLREYHGRTDPAPDGGNDFTTWHAITEDQAEEDALTADLADDGIGSPTVTDVAPTAAEKTDIEDYGVSSRDEVPEALRWGQALRDADNGNIALTDAMRGKNPYRNETFDRPRPNPKRGNQ